MVPAHAGSAVTTPSPGTPAKCNIKDVLQEARHMVAAADISGALEVLDALIADEDVDKAELDMEKWDRLTWPLRRRRALAIIGADPNDAPLAPTAAGTGKKLPGFSAMLRLPQLDRERRCPETATLNLAASSFSRAASTEQTSGGVTMARSTVARATCMPRICQTEAPTSEFELPSARRRFMVADVEADDFLVAGMDGALDPLLCRMEIGSTEETKEAFFLDFKLSTGSA
eukprot:TRINITY_DN40054_c0_g1_i1.p2 TRINITY_DN40054_c0_g1~~TRINITY_DN40054_c0_g1_i1.p2  ORF type:complete len:230 (-),score=40.43 TRINITY_DN40054_c0_g1_i1:228-917(-)